ncbi:LysR substrate-binding domain-containing protein [Falsiroseomonas sp.]|uniref:LysR substrate-binding domain-containing protein n=1 Tax=Falsiroseomonas sp. TaxID=2870721 RepID=UPI00271EE067|nr:LysR substrate-binding domain-containing protein [Falsiroseomonas sp.]MDO9502076.1 LysR substrate-binding domain-containing protein [Falsiroseomonas sp.]
MLPAPRPPFLNGIRAFESAARAGSFVQAAAELHVTPAAVSRMVKLLEERMGVALFSRRANRLELTEAGRRYRDGLVPLLEGLARLTEQVREEAGGGALTVGVGPTFAIRWLIPRLADLQRRQPALEVRITTGGIAAPFSDRWSCGILMGDGEWPGLVATRLFGADLLPVCAPALAAKLRRPSALARATLLRVTHAPGDWPRWLEAAGVPGIAAAGPIFEFHGQAQQAAADGLGVAMGLRPYIDDDLAARRLAAPFPLPVARGTAWYLVHRPWRAADRGVRLFRDWLLAQAASP